MKEFIRNPMTVAHDLECTILASATNDLSINANALHHGSTSTLINNCFAHDHSNLKLLSPPKNNSLFAGPASYDPAIPHACSVDKLMKEQMDAVIREEVSDDAFAVADVGSIIRQHRLWNDKLPMVRPFYAVKCNPDPNILKTMVRLGTGFDCASKGEIEAVLNLGVNPDHVIYANPCKASSQIKYASNAGVRMMTFDNVDELYKIKRYHTNPQLVLRILTDDSKSLCKFGIKFGAHLDITEHLLQVAKQINVEIVGVSFHVGSGCMDAGSFADAIQRARNVFDQGTALGFQMRLLDIGGGFPGADAKHGITFNEIVSQLRPAIETHFPKESGVQIISEPGRYYVSAAYTLAVAVHARRVVRKQINDKVPESFMYYINEGLYSAFNCVYYDHYEPELKILLKDGAYLHNKPLNGVFQEYPCSIWGPTCDSMDLITKNSKMPELHVGDWLYVDAMGAYTVSAASTFNGFQRCHIIWTNTEADTLAV